MGLSNAIAGASDLHFGLFVIVGSVIALATSWGAYTMLVRKRVLQDTPTSLIRSASQGYIELQGYAELMAGAPIIAPLSLKSCVWYSYKVEEKQRTTVGKNRSSEWRTIDSGVCDSLFYLVDPTGRCAIDPEGASVTPSSRDTWYGNDRTPGRINRPAPWLSYTGITQLGKRYRYTERRIESGDPLYALGDFITHGGAGTNFDRKAAIGDLLRDWKRDKSALLERFDADKDGEIDVLEWDIARQTAAQEIDSTTAKVATAPPIDVLGHSRGSRNPFILAAKTEAQMLSRFHYSALGLFALAMLSSITVLWLISIR